MNEIIKRILAIGRILLKYRCNLVASLAHFLLTMMCGVVRFAEGMDRAMGEDKFQISGELYDIASNAFLILLFPTGYLVLLNGSMALGIFTLNSLLVCYSPIWIRYLWTRWTRRNRNGEKDNQTHST